ncbi:MAG: hypothetical protein IH962_05795, partial [Chloroflexi bacterium]|nr:hypothetical protein [Chloroflexota bacterium]
MLLLLFAVSCGGTAAEPVIVEKEVIKEVIKEVVVEKEVIVEVPVEVIVEKEVIKEVIKEVVVFATPEAGLYKAETPKWVTTGAGKHYNGAINFVHRANPGFLDVHYGASSTTVLLPSGLRFNQLLQYDPTAPKEIVGDLAESWEVSEDGMTYTFHIAEANWQDGVPVTADDIVFSLDRMAQEGVTRGR